MRKGFTTSTCAAAATLASLYMLIHNKDLDYVTYKVPAGYTILFPLERVERGKNYVLSCIRKDAGDDPDTTDNILVCAKVKFVSSPGCIIKGGEGVGIVEKPGLFQYPGEAAINPSAKKMIEDVVFSLLPRDRGVEVEIIVPSGSKIAKDTYNPKLGIRNGISIIGTTGMVEPLSDEAWIKTILLEERVKKAENRELLVLVIGNYGMRFAEEKLGIDREDMVKISGYVGDALKGGKNTGFKKILLVGQVGKMIKVSGGIFNVHNKVADGRFEILGFYLYHKGYGRDFVDKVLDMTTVERASELIMEKDKNFFSYIAKKVTEKYLFYLGSDDIEMGSVIYSLNHGFLGMDNEAKVLIEEYMTTKDR